MGEKKRKESSGAADMVPKKSKKSKSTDRADAAEGKDNVLASMPTPEPAIANAPKSKTSSAENGPVASAKKSRKRAADFMDGDEGVPIPSESAAPVKKHKSKKTKKGKHDELLSADGVNGVVEHSGDQDFETATSHKPVSTSMQAEAERTVEHELQDEFNGLDQEDEQDDEEDEIEEDDNAAVLLAGFDSDTEDHQKDKDLDLTTTPALSMDKKTRKKLKNLQDTENQDGPGTVYVGRIPHGFYEKEMKEYFSQFGDISRLRLSRNKRTGASKHFAFIEFKSNEVAKIVADTMDNYLLFGHILKCKYAEPGSLHPDVWKGADKKFRKIPHEKLERQKLAAPKTEQQWQKKVDKEQRKRDLKAKKLKSLGLDMPTSVLADPSVTLQQRLAAEDEAKQIEDSQSEPAGLIEPPAGLPKDEVAVKASKKSKKDKTKKADADTAAETDIAVDLETPADTKSKTAKKEKKKKASTELTEPPTQAAEETPIIEEAKAKTEGKAKKEKKDKKKKAVEQVVDAEPLTNTEGGSAGTEDAVSAKVEEPSPNTKSPKKEKKDKKKKKKAVEEDTDAEVPTNTEGDAAGTDDAVSAKVEEPTPDTKSSKKDKKASKKAAQKPAEVEPEDVPTTDAAEHEAEPAMDTNADFISFGAASDDLPAHKKERKEKKEKKRKERKNLVKARGPKSNLVATKPKNTDPTATGRGGIPLLGKDKYNKAKRQEYKEIKKQMLSKRGGRRG